MNMMIKLSTAILFGVTTAALSGCQSDDRDASYPTSDHQTMDHRSGGTASPSSVTGDRGNRAGPGYTGSNTGTATTGSITNAPEPGYRQDTTPGSTH